MIYLFTALYCEAQIFIEQYHLKKVMDSTRFQQFYNEHASIRLTVTGPGEIAAAAAVSSVCTECRPAQGDYLLNAGICGGFSRREGIFLANKLTERATGKTFYPDMLYRHYFKEAGLITGMLPWNRSMTEKTVCKSEACSGDLYDMEAAAVYQAGAYFFAPHQMFFLKIISDCGEGRLLSADDARRCIQAQAYEDRIFMFLEQLLQAGYSREYEDSDHQRTQGAVEKWCRKLSTDLYCTKAMEHVLKQHIRYAVLSGIDFESVIDEMYRNGRLPCKDKREGKQCFEALRQRLL